MHACWLNGEVQNVTMRVGSYGRRQVETFEISGRRVSMIKLLSDLHLALDDPVKTEELEAWC